MVILPRAAPLHTLSISVSSVMTLCSVSSEVKLNGNDFVRPMSSAQKQVLSVLIQNVHCTSGWQQWERHEVSCWFCRSALHMETHSVPRLQSWTWSALWQHSYCQQAMHPGITEGPMSRNTEQSREMHIIYSSNQYLYRCVSTAAFTQCQTLKMYKKEFTLYWSNFSFHCFILLQYIRFYYECTTRKGPILYKIYFAKVF